MQAGYPGHGYPGYGYPPPRSPAPRTLGTLSIIFGSVVSLLSLVGLVVGRQLAGFTVRASQQEAFERYLREVHGASRLLSALMLMMSIALIYIGLQQRAYKRAAVRASITWGIVALAVLVVQIFVQLTVIGPALDRFVDAISQGPQIVPMSGIMKFSSLFGVAFYAPYPIILIATFRKPKFVAIMDQPVLPEAKVV
ncbi:MAG TPA: hypothetical protein VLX92_15240 [Kofleriaceae bacterium]|nr:hypothetical protein [Kofleriaceae bacterium]